jgi:hypothetical protein
VDAAREPWLSEAHAIPVGPGRQLLVDVWYPCTSDKTVLEHFDRRWVSLCLACGERLQRGARERQSQLSVVRDCSGVRGRGSRS